MSKHPVTKSLANRVHLLHSYRIQRCFPNTLPVCIIIFVNFFTVSHFLWDKLILHVSYVTTSTIRVMTCFILYDLIVEAEGLTVLRQVKSHCTIQQIRSSCIRVCGTEKLYFEYFELNKILRQNMIFS